MDSSSPQVSKILPLKLRQTGDVVFTTPAIRALCPRFPDAHLSYIIEAAAAALFTDNPCIDEVIVAPKPGGAEGFLAELALIERVRAGRYDLVIDFHGGRRASLLTWLSSVPTRIGSQVLGRSWMYIRRVARPRAFRPRHTVENRWDLVAPLDIDPPDPTAFPLEMRVDSAAAARVAERLSKAGVSLSAWVIIVHVSASSPFRRWPTDSFAETVAALAASGHDRRVIVTAGPSEPNAAERIIEAARGRLGHSRADCVVRCREFSLAELRALAERAALYIGGDSGPLHVAATLFRPDRRFVWSDAANPLAPLARRWTCGGGGRSGPAAMPAMRPARVRAGRLSLSRADRAGAGHRCSRAAARKGRYRRSRFVVSGHPLR